MKTTLSIIKADVGSIGGHVSPGHHLLHAVRQHVASGMGGLLTDFSIASTGDDIAILMAHAKGVGNAGVHRLAWDAFKVVRRPPRNRGSTAPGKTCWSTRSAGT